jgi:superfamily II DNA or RNA helicase
MVFFLYQQVLVKRLQSQHLSQIRKVNTLILVHNRQLAEKGLERITVFLTKVLVGSLLGGKDKLTYDVDVATYQSLVSRNGIDINFVVEKYGHLSDR